MAIATHPTPTLLSPAIVSAYSKSSEPPALPLNEPNLGTSMSESHHQGIFSFANGLRPESTLAHQIGQEKLREQAFEPPPSVQLLGIGGRDGPCGAPEYEPTGMLSEMLGFPLSGSRAATSDLSEQGVQPSYRVGHSPIPPRINGQMVSELWFGGRHGSSGNGSSGFLPSPQFPTWLHDSSHDLSQGSYQGLSLSLSSSLNQLEVPKVEEQLRINNIVDGGLLSYDNDRHTYRSHSGAGTGLLGPSSLSISSSSLGVVNTLRNSRYATAAQELLGEFCCVSNSNCRAQVRRPKLHNGRGNSNPSLMNSSAGGVSAGGSSSTSSNKLPPLSAADRAEQQRRKTKLLTMLDEVERRYNHYREQMQMVVGSFDMVMGPGAAVPYMTLAQKAMSRHFRCLKDAVVEELRSTCERLGEKDASGSLGVTKGETPRLKLLEQSWRQQRAFHQPGMIDQEPWRPQRGLPDRSVNVLRSWLFEHFLHPYPSDADKLLLSRQAGLSRNQVSNWFINARVRLWKPMVEEMYQQESKEAAGTKAEATKPKEAPAADEAEAGPVAAEREDPSFPTLVNAASAAAAPRGHHRPGASAPGLFEPVSVSSTLPRSAACGDVSLTLGLHQGSSNGNVLVPERARLPVRSDSRGLHN